MQSSEFVVQKEEAPVSEQSHNSKHYSTTTRTARTGRRTSSKYRDLLVTSFSPVDNVDNDNGNGDGGTPTVQENSSTVSEGGQDDSVASPGHGDNGQTDLSSFSRSSTAYSTDDDSDVWVTKIEYHPRDGSKKVGCKSATTTIVTIPKEQKLLLQDEKREGVGETSPVQQSEVQNGDIAAKNDSEVNEDIGDATKNDQCRCQQIIEMDPDILAAHVYFDSKNKDALVVTSSSEQFEFQLSCPELASIELGALLKRISDAFWEFAINEGFFDEDEERREKRRRSRRERRIGRTFTSDDETLTYNDVSTYTSTVGDGATTTIATGTSQYDDDTLTYNDTLTFNDTLTRNDGSYTIGDSATYRGFDESTMCDEGTLTTYNDGTTMGDEASFTEEERRRDSVEGNEEPVSNEDSSYGSGSFRSPLSDSYRPTSHLPMGESRSRSVRSNSRFRISLLGPETSSRSKKVDTMEETDSFSYTKSRSLNRDLINSFIELKSNSASSRKRGEQPQQNPSKDVPSESPFFTLGDVEELEHYETEQREGAEEHERDQPLPIWRKFDTQPPMVQSNGESSDPKKSSKDSKKSAGGTNPEESPSPSRQTLISERSPTTNTQSRSLHSRSNSPSRVRVMHMHYGRDDEDVDGDDRPDDTRDDPDFDGPTNVSISQKPTYRTAGPLVLVQEDTPTIPTTPDKKLSSRKFGASDIDGVHEAASPKIPENLTPLARLRHPVSHEVISFEMSFD
jgi:hypothetical protein